MLNVILLAALSPSIVDAWPERSRYMPNEPADLVVQLGAPPPADATINAVVTDLGHPVGRCPRVRATGGSDGRVKMVCSLPAKDFHGYRVEVFLQDAGGRVLASRSTAVDVSSDWARYPRYGYLSRYSLGEGAKPGAWMEDLARFHINGVQFYDFQYRHEDPLAGTVAKPAAAWKDIAGRPISGAIVRSFIDKAHRHGMMAMAYNASYSAYEDAFARQNPLPIRWATWPTANAPRTPTAAKSFDLNLAGWTTSKLFYMNQNDLGWQRYLFERMRQLFAVYPFDGWHIDTFGARTAFAYDGSPVDYVAGFAPYIDAARAALGRRIVFNAVNAIGQAQVARSTADIVYSELWENHETYLDIAATAEEVTLANPGKAHVFAAYVHRRTDKDGVAPANKTFNTPSVLLLDAVIFATGGAHIELGDGGRMLTNEYFPNERLAMTPELVTSLRGYYDFATAYETLLRGGVRPLPVQTEIVGEQVSGHAVADTVWTFARGTERHAVIHLLNLKGSDDTRWRDIDMSRTIPPVLRNRTVRMTLPFAPKSVGWASPDVDDGRFHQLPFTARLAPGGRLVEVVLPSLRYWSMLVAERR